MRNINGAYQLSLNRKLLRSESCRNRFFYLHCIWSHNPVSFFSSSFRSTGATTKMILIINTSRRRNGTRLLLSNTSRINSKTQTHTIRFQHYSTSTNTKKPLIPMGLILYSIFFKLNCRQFHDKHQYFVVFFDCCLVRDIEVLLLTIMSAAMRLSINEIDYRIERWQRKSKCSVAANVRCRKRWGNVRNFGAESETAENGFGRRIH